jgi:3-hydroxyacyl-CoA dehydrogenase
LNLWGLAQRFNFAHPCSQTQVVLADINEAVLNKARDRISQSLARVAKKQFAGNDAAGNEFKDKAMVSRAGELGLPLF